MILGGIDIGTTGCKISLYQDDGTYLAVYATAYPFARSAGVSSFDAGVIMDAVLLVLKQAVEAYPQLDAVGISSFGEAFVLLDQEDNVLYPTMLNTDPRGIEQVRGFAACCGEERICEITGARPHSMFSAAKILWMKEKEPAVWEQADKLLLMEDFVVYMLTGVRQIDYALASRTQLFDINHLVWSKELLKQTEIREELFSRPVPPGTEAGVIRREIAEKIGCKAELRVITSAHDQISAAIGAGVLSPGCAVDGAGTHECITPVFRNLTNKAPMYDSNLAIVPFVDNQYVTYAFLFTGCALTEWFIDTLAGHMVQKAKEAEKSVFEMLEADMHSEPSGILVLPHFDGAATPYMDEGSKGAFVGMSVSTKEADLYQALMEGIAYEMRMNMEQAREAGLEIRELHATGGGANSERWLQIKADILNVPIRTMENPQAGAIGTIILMGKALGIYKTLEEGVGRLVVPGKVFVPNPENSAKYQKIYERYQKLYAAVRPLI